MTAVVKHMDDLETHDELELEELYSWVDKIPLSRPKRNICRDFSDGVLVAEVVKHFMPKIVDIHNYTAASATTQKMQNWFLMNRKVFVKLSFQLTEDLIRDLSIGKPGLIERFLMHLRAKLERAMWDMQKDAGDRLELAHQQKKSTKSLYNPKGSKTNVNDKPEADQNLGKQKNVPPKKSSVTGTEASEVKAQGIGTTVSPGRQKPALTAGPYRGNAKIKTMEDVPRAVYEEKEQECLAKEETIQILQAKVRRLEHLLHLKDIRIEDLQTRLESTRPTGVGKR